MNQMVVQCIIKKKWLNVVVEVVDNGWVVLDILELKFIDLVFMDI